MSSSESTQAKTWEVRYMRDDEIKNATGLVANSLSLKLGWEPGTTLRYQEWMEAGLRKEQAGFRMAYLAEQGRSQMIGFAWMRESADTGQQDSARRSSGKTADIEMLQVASGHRRKRQQGFHKGVGTDLLEQMLTRASLSGFRTLRAKVPREGDGYGEIRAFLSSRCLTTEGDDPESSTQVWSREVFKEMPRTIEIKGQLWKCRTDGCKACSSIRSW